MQMNEFPKMNRRVRIPLVIVTHNSNCFSIHVFQIHFYGIREMQLLKCLLVLTSNIVLVIYCMANCFRFLKNAQKITPNY